MTKWQRIKAILRGLLTMLVAPVLVIDPELGCVLIVMVLGLSAAIKGGRMLLYFVTMARHMVGGKTILYQGFILLDFGLFTLGLAEIPSRFIMLYLLLGYLFYGLIGVLRAMEIRKRAMGSWRFKLLASAGDIALGALCLAKFNSMKWAAGIYCLGVIWSALGRIISACRPNQRVVCQSALKAEKWPAAFFAAGFCNLWIRSPAPACRRQRR